MKPIELTITGLHSFREKQTIDFEELCDGGVFGIFGPTGSGKSSILDAITLALYGKVERAANNTHGILNHAEDQLSVSYTFELRNGAKVKRYKVERTYKRTDEHRVKGSISRLIDLEAEPVVLADKASEVNEKVHQLLGLTIDDFTRAVVLPQGKFAEFLSLKGSERRQMLQRLFHLEQYGDELLSKLRTRLGQAKSRLRETEAEQAGLGDASKEALKQAEIEWQNHSLLLEKRTAERRAVREKLSQQQRIWELQLDLERLKEEERKLESQSEEISRMKEQLKLSDQAERLSPYLEYLEAAEKKHNALLETEKKWAAEQALQKEKTSEAKGSYEQAKMEKEKSEPVLAVRKEQLTQLLQTEKERDERKSEMEKLSMELAELEQSRKQAEHELARAGNLLQKAKQKQQEIKQELETQTVSSVYRKSVHSAADLRKEWNYAEEQRREAEKVYDYACQQEEAASKERRARQKKQELEKEKVTLMYSGLLQMFSKASELRNRLEKKITSYQEKAAKARAELEQQRVHSIAIQLSASLIAGEACPVCGSLSHPSPVEGGTRDEGKHHLEEQEVKLEASRAWLMEAENLKLKMEELSSELISDFPWLHEMSLQEESAASMEQIQENEEPELKMLKQDFLHIRTQASSHMKILNQLQTEEQQSAKMEERLRLEVQNALGKFQSAKEKEESLKESWEKAHPDFNLEQLPELMKDMEEKDARFESLQLRVNKSVEYIDQQEKARQNAGDQLAELEKKYIQTSEKKQSVKERLAEKEAMLAKEAGNDPIPVQLKAIQSRLVQLGEQEKQLSQKYEETAQKLRNAEKEHSAALKSLQDAVKTVQEARESWQAQLSQSAMNSILDVRQSLLNHQVKESYTAKTEAFLDNWKQCKADLKRISGELDGRTLDEAAWQQTNQLAEEYENLVSEAEGLRGAALKSLELLKEKHSRYEKLEEQRLEISGKAADLEQLQAVFKGNSFVEYIAEEQLHHVSRDASERLGLLTRQRYAIEVDSQGGFIMRDDANGGVRRPVTSLSGGETFLTSLALALSLSTQIQLRGEFPLQFFFLDEGFGTLDTDLLDTVVTALEKLQSNNLSVGVISHVPELRARLSKKLVVTPADPAGNGTSVALETL
ncbi:AAA family ATPase [Metabacillus sp. 84]|uniref:AAA family ATPase n=1 Tax=unclassified Metabacillus TaxID=2675274 RepID=UPI003CF59734